MASYDTRLGLTGMDGSQSQLYADYLRETLASFDAYADDALTAQPQGRVNYADPQSGLAPGFRRPRDILQLDPDPFGTQTATLGAGVPEAGVTGDSVLALDVFGKRMTREQLQQSSAGRRLLEISERNRSGRRRGFLDALTDVSWTDLPFLSLFATVGKSVSDAVTVSDTFKKLQNGDPVSDDELIKTRLYMAEQEERENGTWGATVGDIVRAAPGFMVEFLASGGLYSAARAGVAKLVGKGMSRLALTRAEKTLMREATEIAARSAISAEKLGAGVKGWAALAGDKSLAAGVIDDAVETTMRTMYRGKVGANGLLGGKLLEDGTVKFADDAAVRQLIRNRVESEFSKTLARNSSEHAVVNWMHSTGQWLQRHISSGLIDHGMWGTEEATVLTSGFTKARSALADAAGALFIEAPIRGSLIWAPNQFVAKPLLGQLMGPDGRTVSASQLSLQQSAYLQGLKDPEAGRRLMEDADAISLGMNWLEYVSENAGRGFGSLARGVGLWFDRSAVSVAIRGVARPATETALAAGEKTAENSGFRLGGALRDFFTKKFGTRAEFRQTALADQVTAVRSALGSAVSGVDDSALRTAIVANSTAALPVSVQDAIERALGKTVARTPGGRIVTGVGTAAHKDFASFVNAAVEAAYKNPDLQQKLAYKTFGRYMVAEWMTRHGIGPETLLNLYQKMGYDGVLGEILEERYSDMAQGFFGWNDKTDRKEIATRLAEGFKGIWPGWDQLTAEAVGFAVPMVTRMGIARLQSRLGGGGKLDKLRERLEFVGDIFRSPTTGRWRIGEYLDVQATVAKEDAKAVESARSDMEAAQARGDADAAREAEERLSVATRTRDRRQQAHVKRLAGLREARTLRFDQDIEAAKARGDEAEAGRLAAERDRIAKVYEGWEGGLATPEGMAREDLDQLVVIEPLSRAAAESEGAESAMRPVDSAQASQGMEAYEAFVDFTPELAKMLYQLDAPLDGEAPSGLRKFAGKLIGLAGAAITGDLSLASADPATWIARDMGVDREFLRSLKGSFAKVRKEAETALKEELRQMALDRRMAELAKYNTARAEQGETYSIPERMIDDRAQEMFAAQARRMAQAYLAAQQVRSFSRAEMRDQALMLAARSRRDEAGAYDVIDTEKRELYRLGADGKVDESSRIGFDEFYERNREDVKRGAVTYKGVDALTADIGRATLDLLSNRTGLTADSHGLPAFLVEMPDHAEFGKLAVYDAAMRLSGFRGMITTQMLRKDQTLEDAMNEGARTRVSSTVIGAVARSVMNPDGTYDHTKADRRLLESVAQGLGLQFDGTANGLEERNRKAAELCTLMSGMEDPNVRFFMLQEDETEDDVRLGNGARTFVRATFRDGKWTCSDQFLPVRVKGEDGKWIETQGKMYEAATEAGLLRKLKADNLNASRVDPHVVFTMARVIETDDLFTAVRSLGLMKRYVALMREVGDESFVHPMARRVLDDKGNSAWAYPEIADPGGKSADDVLAEEIELASRYDGKHLVRPSRDGLTAAQLAEEEKAAKVAWERVYGQKGYIAIGERLLRNANVDMTGALELVTGRRMRTGKYKVFLSQFMGRSGNMYIPIDLSQAADTREAVVDARLMQGWAQNPRLVANAYRSGVEAFLAELDALARSEIARADKEGNAPLADALRDFRATVTLRGYKIAKDPATGKYVRREGNGLTPESYVQMAHAFCCFGAERLERDGYGRMGRVAALIALKDGARQLPHYADLMSLTDLLLGGSGFLGERTRAENEDAVTSRGLAGLVRTYFNEPGALAKLVADMVPGGADWESFLAAADQALYARTKSHIVVDYGGERSGGEGRPPRPPRDVGEWGALIRQIKLASKLDGAEFNDFLQGVFDIAGVATGNRPATWRQALEEQKRVARDYGSLANLLNAKEDAQKALQVQQTKVQELADRIRVLEAAQDDLGTATDQAKVQIGQLLDELAAVSTQSQAAADRVRQIAGQVAVKLKSIQALLNGGAMATETPATESTVVEQDNRSTVEEDEDVDLMLEVDDALELPQVEPNAMYVGTDTLAQAVAAENGEALVETDLSEDEARSAFAVAVYAVLSEHGEDGVSKDEVRRAVDRVFPGLPSYGRYQVMSSFDAFIAQRGNTKKSWQDMAREGLAWTFVDEDKDENEGADTASEDRKVDRSAVDELTGKGLQTFLKLARFVAPETGANLQAFLEGMRDLAREDAEGGDASDLFLKSLLCPREATEVNGVALDTQNKRDAVFDYRILRQLKDSPELKAHIKALWTTGRSRAAFLLSYLAAMPEADRSRFAQLIGSATGCDALRFDGAVMEEANPETKRLTQAALAAALTPLVGRSKVDAGDAAKRLATAFTARDAADSRFSARSTDYDTYNINRKAIADELEPVLGRDNPVVMALRSDATAQYIKAGLKSGDKEVSSRFQSYLKALAYAMAWKKETFGGFERIELQMGMALQTAVQGLAAGGGAVTYEEAEAAAVAAITTGDSRKDLITMSERSSHYDNPLATLLSIHASAQPVTVMTAEVDRRRSNKDSSVAVTSRGTVPLIARWLDSDACRKLVRGAYGAKTDEELDRQVARMRQDMRWPDGTRILAKNISVSYHSDEIYDACVETFRRTSQGRLIVPVYAGDHASSVMIQVPSAVLEVLKQAVAEPAPEARLAKRRERMEAGVGEKEAESAELDDRYEELAHAVSKAIGLDLLGDDTKRSAISSLEQAGLSMTGVRMGADGAPEFGKCTVHIIYSMSSRANARLADPSSMGNEELKGITMMAGYGAERQRRCAKLQGTGTLKCHLISTSGRDLMFLKSLSVAPRADRGEFLGSDYKRMLYDHLQKGVKGREDLDTAVLTDLDSYKVGPANSKWIRMRWTTDEGTFDKSVLEYVIDRLEQKYTVAGELKLPEKFDLDAEFGDVSELLWEAPRSDGKELKRSDADGKPVPVRISDILPGLQIGTVEGLEGTVLDISYREDGLTSYSVANVSHRSTPESLRTPRNHVMDALAAARAERDLLRESGMDTGFLDDIEDFVRRWGLAVSATFGSPEAIASLISTSPGLRRLRDAHEPVDGQVMREELFRTAWAQMRRNLNLPMNAIDCPLVSAGAGASVLRDANGNILYDGRGFPRISMLTKSQMVKDLNRGSLVFSESESREVYGGFRRHLALAAVNVRTVGFRYGWWMDEAEFRRTFGLEDGASDRDILDALANELTQLHDEELRDGVQLERRRRLAGCFLDHHRVKISDYSDRELKGILFDDLFAADPRGGRARVFDRSAVQIGEDRVFLDKEGEGGGGESHIFLGGSAFGLPRTPSYNGSMWLQVVRASVPVTEIAPAEGSSRYLPGLDAMVAPDPMTNEILGCDHDGDKTKIYMLHGAGIAKFLDDLPDVSADDLATFGTDPGVRSRHCRALAATGLVDMSPDPVTGAPSALLTQDARRRAGNRTARDLFDMARMLPVEGAPERSGETQGPRRQAFVGNIASRPTRAFPGSKTAKAALLAQKHRRPGADRTIGRGHRLDEPRLAAEVSAKANDAADARARIVSLARALHGAYVTGWYARGRGSLFGDGLTARQWFNLMYIVDGISNATFDDIKEQLCSRLGWTSGMMNCVVTDLLLNRDRAGAYGAHPVQTDDEASQVLERYVDSVNNYGSRFYMMVASDEADHMRFTDARKQLGSRWNDVFGLEQNDNNQWAPKTPPVRGSAMTPAQAIVSVVGDALDMVNAGRSSKLQMSVSDAYGMLAYAGRDASARHGYLFWLLKEAAGVEGTDDLPAIALDIKASPAAVLDEQARDRLAEKVRDFLLWSEKSSQLDSASKIGNSYNYLVADPGSDTADSLSTDVDEWAKRAATDAGEGDAFLPYYQAMNAVTRSVYGFGYGLETMAVRAAHALRDYQLNLGTVLAAGWTSDGTLTDWVQGPDGTPVPGHLACAVRGLMSLRRVSKASTDVLLRRANAQTIPNLIAALQCVDGKTPTQVLAMLKGIADAYGGIDRTLPDAREPGQADIARWNANSGWGDVVTPGSETAELTGAGDVFRALKGIASLFECMYRLATTSTEHFDLSGEGNAGFGYFQTQKDHRFEPKKNFDKELIARYEGGGSKEAPLWRISPRCQGSTDTLASRAKDLVARIMSGESFVKPRTRAGGAETIAKSFALTETNLDALMAETQKGKKADSDSATVKAFQDDIRTAKQIVKAIGDVTPQRMFRDLLPLYTAMATRTEGAPSAGSMSLLTLLPGVYERWAERAVANDRVCRPLVDAFLASNLAPVNLASTRTAPQEGMDGHEGIVKTDIEAVPGATLAAKRENPSYRNVTDPFAGGGALAHAAEWLMSAPAAPAPSPTPAAQAGQEIARGPDPKKFDESKASEPVRRMVGALRALCGQWAKVRATSETTLVVEGQLRGGFTSGAPKVARVSLLISASGDLMAVDSPEQIDALAGSRAFAASLVNQYGERLGLRSVRDFFLLPFPVRQALARRYAVGGATLNRAVKIVDARGMAVLTGAIKLGRGKADTKLYHEYFHGMMSLFKALNVFSEADVVQLRRTFGEPPAGSGMLFDEERAAERFRKFVERGGKAEKDAHARGFFRRLLDAIAVLFRELVGGFRYTGEPGEEDGFSADEKTLFSMVIYGVAAHSDTQEDAAASSAALDISDRLSRSGAREIVIRKDADGTWRWGERRPGEKIDGKTVRWATKKDSENAAVAYLRGSLAGDGTLGDREFTRGFFEMEPNNETAAAVDAIEKGAESAGDRIAAIVAAREPEADKGALARALGTEISPIRVPEEASFALNLGFPYVGTQTIPTWAAARTVAEMAAPDVEAKLGADGVKRLFGMEPSAYAKTMTPAAMRALKSGVKDAVLALDPSKRSLGPNAKLWDDATFETALCLHKGLSAIARQDKDAESAYLKALSDRNADMEGLSAAASAYDVSAAVLAAGGVLPSEQIVDAIERLGELARRSDIGEPVRALVKRCGDALKDALRALDGPDAFTDELSGRSKALGAAIEAFRPGLNWAGLDSSGAPGLYWAVDPDKTANDQAKENVKIYGPALSGGTDAERTAAQAAVHLTLTTLYRAKASLKYHRELGYLPATEADVAMVNQYLGTVDQAKSTEDWCAENAIGNSNFLDNEGLVDYYDQPYFVAENMEQWLSAAVRPTFGGSPFGDAVRQEHHEYAGIVGEMKDLENFQAFLAGDSVEANCPILACILRDRRFGMENGQVVHREDGERLPGFDMVDGTAVYRKSGDKLLGFDNYGNLTCSVTLTEDELATVDWWKKSLVAYMAGQKRMVTGVDRIWFSETDAGRTRDQWSQERITERFDDLGSDDKLTRFEMTLRRLIWQLPSCVRDKAGMDFYDRFADAAREACGRADSRFAELKRRAAGPGARVSGEQDLTPDERREYESFDFNARVLDDLEAQGFIICRRNAAGKATEGVVVVDADAVDEMFQKSTALAKLTSDARWHRTGWDMAARRNAFSREAFVKPWREIWGRLSRFVREHPWMTQGDAKNLTAFGTPVPFFRGTGLFMYNAVRASRADQVRRSRVESLSRHERMFLWACTAENRGYRVSDPEHRNNVRTLLDILHDVARLGNLEGDGLLNALMDGELQPGGKYADLAARRGIRLGKDPTVAEVSDAVYGYMVDRAFAEARGTGWTAREARTVDTLVSIYEDRALGDGEFTGMMGVSPEMMYRNHGCLPANHQLGHLIRTASEGITNALAHRSTFMTLMTTPSADGAPVYYARPDDMAAERSGIPDACWGRIARWWAEFHRLSYDETKSGVKNAQRLYDEIKSAGTDTKNAGGKRWRLVMGDSDHRYIPLADDHDLASVSGIMCMEDEETGTESSAINALAQGEAAGYMKQFVDAGRNLGWLPFRQAIHKSLSWSKSMSVAFSLFFPLATRFESPIGAVGAIPTIVGNAGPGFLREHPELANALQRIFGGSGWITKDLLGFRDVLQMMDSRDPFLAELKSWAHALGITLSDSLANPTEPTKSIVASDVARMKAAIRRAWPGAVGARLGRALDALATRPGDRAFNYALNATKLAVVAQLAMKLRHEAKRRGKAFDPIRDLKRYAGYINAEIGGIDESRYAWAHPVFRGIMNCMLFSWQWTRGAWEAGGGGVIEDVLFGGHSATREERQHLMGRWARMYGEVMIGVPLLMQAVALALAKAMGGGDDDDKWFTWQNESKVGMSAFDITPLMKAVHRHEDVAGIAGRIAGAAIGAAKFGPLGAVGGLLFGNRLVPDYTGKDQANQTTRNRRYYMHFGKQGWEFFRWFDKPGQQFMGKQNMVTQRFLEGFFGRNLGYLERKLPWADMGAFERWFCGLDSASVNLAKAFLPFSAGQMMSFGDAGILPVLGPVQMGASQTAIQLALEYAIWRWARNDRTAYSWGGRTAGKNTKKAKALAGRFADILADARRNGLDPEQQLNTALGTVARSMYGKLFSLLPDTPDGEYDVKEVERICRALNRLLTKKASVLQSAKKRLEKQGRPWARLEPEMQARLEKIINRHMGDPFSGEAVAPAQVEEKARDY